MSRQSFDGPVTRFTKRIGEFSTQTFVRQKLNNWAGYLLVTCLACFLAWVFARDLLEGVFFFGVLIVFCTAILCFTKVEFGFYLLFFLGFFGYYASNYLTDGELPVGLIFDIIVLIIFLGLIASRKDFKSSWKEFTGRPLVMLMFLTFFYGILEMFNPNTMGASASNWLGVRKFLEFILILFAAYTLLDSYQKIRRYTMILLVVATICAIYGCIQQWFGLASWELTAILADPHAYALLWAGGEFRKFSTLPDPAAFGIIMAVCSVFFIVLSIYEKNRLTKLTYIGCVILMLLGMGYSGTRTAYAVLLAGIAFFILFNIDKPPVQKFGVFIFIVFLAIMFGPFSGNNTVRRFRSTFMGEKDESYRVRLVERAFIKPYIHHHPIGGGMGTTGFNGAVEHPGNPLANFQPDGAYVMRAAETGWIGLLINCTLYFFILKTGIQAFFRVKDPRIKVYYAAGVSCIFAFYVGDYAQLAVGSPADVGIYFGLIAMILKQKHYDKIYTETPTV